MLVEKVKSTLWEGNNIFVAGNGGSATTSNHMVIDLGVGLQKPKDSGQIYSLVADVGLVSKIANDSGFENLLVEMAEEYVHAKDVVIIISASGQSKNLVKLAEWTKQRNIETISLTGFHGGELMEITDFNINITTEIGEYGLVENMHLYLIHFLKQTLMDGDF
jgi:D-sedoheptulose 7-phosphate isomerase